jgi:hypothetical protein
VYNVCSQTRSDRPTCLSFTSQDAGGKLIPTADLLAAGAKLEQGLYSTVKYNFNASVPAQKAAFVELLKTVSGVVFSM